MRADEFDEVGVEVVALAYERSTDFSRSQTSVRTFQQRFNVKYPMLITGAAAGDVYSPFSLIVPFALPPVTAHVTV